MRILAVDTNMADLNQFTEILIAKFPNDEIVPFSNPMSAVKFGVNHKIDAVFTEIPMRGVDGFTLVKLLRQYNERMAVYFVTGTEEYASVALSSRPDGYLLKPVAAESLRSKSILPMHRTQNGDSGHAEQH